MAGAFIKGDVDDQAILDTLAKLQRLGADLRPVFLDIGKFLERSHRQRWDREVTPDGAKWAALSPAHQTSKVKNADKILVLNAYPRDTMAPQSRARSLKFGTSKGAFGRSKRSPRPWV